MGEKYPSDSGADTFGDAAPRTAEEISAQFDAIKREGGHSAIARACQADPEIEAELIRRWLSALPVPKE